MEFRWFFKSITKYEKKIMKNSYDIKKNISNFYLAFNYLNFESLFSNNLLSSLKNFLFELKYNDNLFKHFFLIRNDYYKNFNIVSFELQIFKKIILNKI